ncbi:hypothetical protein TSOC_015333, partial [Tetrabaena socialis]
MTHLMTAHAALPAAADAAGRTALMHAAAGGALQSVRLLLSLPSLPRAPPPPAPAPGPDQAATTPPPGPDGDLLHQTDLAGYGPLHHACLGGSVECVQALRDRGLALSAADPGSLVLLRLAARAGHAGVVDWMLREGV